MPDGAIVSAEANHAPGKTGRWVAGQSGNPKGQPKGIKTITVLKNNLELAVRERLTATKVTQIVNKMAELALAGDVKAAKLILDMAISKAAVHEANRDQAPTIHITIENATIAAKQAVANQPIEAEYNDISGKTGEGVV